jgi:hypothetical protein
MIDRTYGHLAPGADDYERRPLDAFDAGESVGRAVDAQEDEMLLACKRVGTGSRLRRAV